MSKKNKQEWLSFTEKGQRWMICKHCQSEYVQVDDDTAAITCSHCVIKKTLALKPMDEFFAKQKPKTGRPAGWHWMAEYVDKDGNVKVLKDEQDGKGIVGGGDKPLQADPCA